MKSHSFWAKCSFPLAIRPLENESQSPIRPLATEQKQRIMAAPTRTSSRKSLLLLSLVLALLSPWPTTVHAQEQPIVVNGVPIVVNGVPIDFGVFTTAVVTVLPLSHMTPKPRKTRWTPALTLAPATDAPAPTTQLPATAAPVTPVTPVVNPTTQPTVAPSDSPAIAPAPAPASTPAPAPTLVPSTAVVTPAPTKSYPCDEATTSIVTKLYENNDVLEGDCAAANNYYRFPFEDVPSRAQLLNMSKTAACTVLMQALLQLVPKECDFKRIALRSTAEAILQLAKNMKKKGENVMLPSEEAITQAIEARRQKLLNSGGSKAVDGGIMTASTAASPSSGSSWTISDNITSVDDDGQHILMDTDLLVVGTWSDNPENYAGAASRSSGSVAADADAQLKLLDSKATAAPTTSSTSGSLQSAAVSVKAALVLAWVFVFVQ